MTSTWTEQDSIELTATLVAHDGYRLPLVGPERYAAVTAMIRAGLTTSVMAHRLRVTEVALNGWARRAGIHLPRRPPQHWSEGYLNPSKTAAARAAQRATQRSQGREGVNPR